ncbi:MAG TPA: heparan-alpha-glucosaminide N-acetyltransferase domain-containing protein [Isosphaeraceae bacterium]|jgi:uncharacterized membrane protein|nr:heparan-alpha-glucosaminide N-acetyltransferase domain-containing protein [Isosphaeraceae bacterium]
MTELRHCPECGAVLDDDLTLCPACLLKAGLGDPTTAHESNPGSTLADAETLAADPGPSPGREGGAVKAGGRLASVDVLRGLVMVVMVLDHTRDFFTDTGLNPTDPERAGVALFLTRWVTHFCAPVFVFLAGTGAYLHGLRTSRAQLAVFLATRGAWLIVLELTVVKFGLLFRPEPGLWLGIVLWAIGWSMIALAVVVFLPTPVVAAFGVAMIALHNLADGVDPTSLGRLGAFWIVLHQRGFVNLPGGVNLFVLYPLVPWVGVMAAGYGLGPAFLLEPGRRRRLFATLGLTLTAAFVALRWINRYGDPTPWVVGSSSEATVLSFLNCEKYPPSLLFLLMTLGPAILALSPFDREPGPVGRRLATLGRVPLFFYVLQWYVIHGLALAIAAGRGQPTAWLFARNGPPQPPPECQYSLPVVYLLWATVVVLLFLPCRRFAELKRRRRDAWLSFL